MKLCHVQCSNCGKQVSNAVESYLDEGLIVRAWVECAECVDKEAEQLTPEEAKELMYCFMHESRNRYGKVNMEAPLYLKLKKIAEPVLLKVKLV